MKPHQVTIEKTGLRYGLLVTLGLVGYFLLMKAFGLEHNLELRALNLVILFSGILAAVKYFKYHSQYPMTYLKGIGVGMLTSFIAVVAFAILVFAYVTLIQPEFMEVIKAKEPFGEFLNPFTVSAVIILEGVGSGFLCSFAVMQWYKTSHFANPVQK